MLKDADLGMKRTHGAITVFALLIISVLIPYLASFNSYLGLIIHFISLYYIIILTAERIDFKSYMAFILIYIFANGNPVAGNILILRILSIFLFAGIIAMVYYSKHTNDANFKTIQEILKTTHNEHMEFALKLAFSLSLAMFLSDILNIHKHMWFTITVLSLTQINLSVTLSRMKHRLLSTIIGSLIYIFIFGYLIPDNFYVYISLIMSYVYTFIKRYDIQMIFITINSMIANEIFFHSDFHSVASRIILVFVGVVFSYIITQVNFKKIIEKFHHI